MNGAGVGGSGWNGAVIEREEDGLDLGGERIGGRAHAKSQYNADAD